MCHASFNLAVQNLQIHEVGPMFNIYIFLAFTASGCIGDESNENNYVESSEVELDEDERLSD